MTKPHKVLGSPEAVLFIILPDTVVLRSGWTKLKILTVHTCYECQSRLYRPQIWMMLMFLQLPRHFLQQTAPLSRLSAACSCTSALRELLHFSASKNTKSCWRGMSLITWCNLPSSLCHLPVSPVGTNKGVHWLVPSCPVTPSCTFSSAVGQPPFM